MHSPSQKLTVTSSSDTLVAMRAFVDRHRPQVVLLCLSLLAFLFCAMTFELFPSGYYSSDGFHCFSALRNTLRGHGFLYEGLTFEHFLGNHAYLSLTVLLPLIGLFPSALTLGVITILAKLVSVFLFYLIVREWAFRLEFKSGIIPEILAFVYLIYGISLDIVFAVYLFQPDFLLEPFLLATIYLWSKEKIGWASVCLGLFLLTKEELILVFPGVLLLLTLIDLSLFQRPIALISRRIGKLFLLWIVLSGVSIAAIVIARRLNIFHGSSRAFEIERFSVVDWKALFQEWKYWIGPLLPMLLFGGLVLRRKALALGAIALSFVVGRLAMDWIIYLRFPREMWPNTLFAPTLFSSVGAMFLLAAKRFFPNGALPVWKKINLTVVLLLTLLIAGKGLARRRAVVFLQQFLSGQPLAPHNEVYSDLVKAQALVEVRPTGAETIVMDEFQMWLFPEYSHVSWAWLDSLEGEHRDYVLSHAAYLIVPLNRQSPELFRDHQVLAQLPHFAILKRKPAPP